MPVRSPFRLDFDEPTQFERWMPLAIAAIVVLLVIGGFVVLRGVDFGGGADGESRTDRYEVARAAAADTLLLSQSEIVCRDYGAWNGRRIAFCHERGDTRRNTGCWDIVTGEDLTIAVRNERGVDTC